MSLFRAFVVAVIVPFVVSVPLFSQEPSPQVSRPFVLQEKPAVVQEKVVATVGADKITETELSDTVRSQLQGQQVPPEAMKEIRDMILNSIIDGRLVKQFIAAKKIVIDAKETDAAIAAIKKQVAEAGMDFAKVLQDEGVTEQVLRGQIEEQMAFKKYAESQISDQKIQQHFAGHKQEFDGTQVKASHVLIKLEETSTPQDRKAAADKIAAIRQEIAGGLDFAEAAKKYSACPSSAQGGDLGFFARHGQMVEPFAAAAFTLPVGEVSQPVETEFGYHLIKVTETKPGEMSFEQAKDSVKRVLFMDLWRNAAAEQRKITKVEISKG